VSVQGLGCTTRSTSGDRRALRFSVCVLSDATLLGRAGLPASSLENSERSAPLSTRCCRSGRRKPAVQNERSGQSRVRAEDSKPRSGMHPSSGSYQVPQACQCETGDVPMAGVRPNHLLV